MAFPISRTLAALCAVGLLACGGEEAASAKEPAPVAQKSFFDLTEAERVERYDDLISREAFEASLASPRPIAEIWPDVVANRDRAAALASDIEEMWRPEIEEIWRKLTRLHQLTGEIGAAIERDPELDDTRRAALEATLSKVRAAIGQHAYWATRYDPETLQRFMPQTDMALLTLEAALPKGTVQESLLGHVSERVREDYETRRRALDLRRQNAS